MPRTGMRRVSLAVATAALLTISGPPRLAWRHEAALKLASWLRTRSRAHERHVAEHERAMAKVEMAPRFGRKVRIPAPPGGWQNGSGKRPSAGFPKNHDRPLPPPRD
jgi:hypothetical protein